MNDLDNLKAIAAFQPDYFGFIFYEKSPRYLTLKDLPAFENVKKVGVFVNAYIDAVVEKQNALNLDIVQLHGDESLEYIIQLKSALGKNVNIFKAISILNEYDFKLIGHYQNLVDLFILDTKTPLRGGSGQQFNWELLKHYNSETPFLLSGGIGPKDAELVSRVYDTYPQMKGVDINSKFEIEPGVKSIEQIELFINEIKSKEDDKE
jgi:phosphoribosylanthranilate isomerase